MARVKGAMTTRKTKHFISSLARHHRAFDSGHCAATSSYLYGIMRLMADSLVTSA